MNHGKHKVGRQLFKPAVGLFILGDDLAVGAVRICWGQVLEALGD